MAMLDHPTGEENTLCVPLTKEEKEKFQQLRAAEARRLRGDSAKAREAFIDRQSQRLVARTGMDLPNARRTIERQCDGVLLLDVELPFDDPELEDKTVADVLAEPARFDGCTLADPIEGVEYGRCKARVMRRDDGTIWINSFAHGRTVYELAPDQVTKKDVDKSVNNSSREDIGTTNVASLEKYRATVVTLSRLALDEYALRRKTAAKELNVAAAHLDQAVKTARKNQRAQRPINPSWRDLLIRNDDGEVLPNAANVLQVLRSAPEWNDVLALNEFNQRPMLVHKPPWAKEWSKPRPFADADAARALIWMQENGIPLCRMEAVHQALAVAIDDNRFHPVRDYLDAQSWDGKPRLDGWLTYYLGVDPIEHYTGPVGRCWMIAAVARIYRPGCQAKYCLVLEGDQDLGKSTALETLGGEWYTDDIAELGTKDSALQAGNAWIVELAELDSVRKAHVAAVKAFISRKVDRFRKPFGRNVIDQERQCIMAGSINPGAEYLLDQTGNVRFWPVLCTKIDIVSLTRDRDQLWAEAVHRFKNGEKWWIEDEQAVAAAREQQDARAEGDSWTDAIKNYLDERPTTIAVTTTQILRNALYIDLKDHDKAKQSRVGIIMRRQLEWRRRKSGDHRWFEHPDASDTEFTDTVPAQEVQAK
jgi:predicted P-loop ATPase